MKEILFRKKPNKITMVHECQIWEKHFLFKKKKKNKITMTHDCQIWYLVNRLLPGSIYNEIRIFLDRL